MNFICFTSDKKGQRYRRIIHGKNPEGGTRFHFDSLKTGISGWDGAIVWTLEFQSDEFQETVTLRIQKSRYQFDTDNQALRTYFGIPNDSCSKAKAKEIIESLRDFNTIASYVQKKNAATQRDYETQQRKEAERQRAHEEKEREMRKKREEEARRNQEQKARVDRIVETYQNREDDNGDEYGFGRDGSGGDGWGGDTPPTGGRRDDSDEPEKTREQAISEGINTLRALLYGDNKWGDKPSKEDDRNDPGDIQALLRELLDAGEVDMVVGALKGISRMTENIAISFLSILSNRGSTLQLYDNTADLLRGTSTRSKPFSVFLDAVLQDFQSCFAIALRWRKSIGNLFRESPPKDVATCIGLVPKMSFSNLLEIYTFFVIADVYSQLSYDMSFSVENPNEYWKTSVFRSFRVDCGQAWVRAIWIRKLGMKKAEGNEIDFLLMEPRRTTIFDAKLLIDADAETVNEKYIFQQIRYANNLEWLLQCRTPATIPLVEAEIRKLLLGITGFSASPHPSRSLPCPKGFENRPTPATYISIYKHQPTLRSVLAIGNLKPFQNRDNRFELGHHTNTGAKVSLYNFFSSNRDARRLVYLDLREWLYLRGRYFLLPSLFPKLPRPWRLFP